MRQISWKTAGLLVNLLFVSLSGPSLADDLVYLDRSDRGFNLPGVSLPQGQDEVHAADGTTCRSAIGGSGTYLDVGAIKDSLGKRGSDDVATYARVVVPLGIQPKRLDCARLYELEVERLQLELRLLKMGLSAQGGDGTQQPPQGASGRWAQDGWSNNGMSGGQPQTARPGLDTKPVGSTRQAATTRRKVESPEEPAFGLY